MTERQIAAMRELLEDATWRVSGRNQGQIVEVAYADLGALGVARRVTDQSEPIGGPERVRYAVADWEDEFKPSDPDDSEWTPNIRRGDWTDIMEPAQP